MKIKTLGICLLLFSGSSLATPQADFFTAIHEKDMPTIKSLIETHGLKLLSAKGKGNQNAILVAAAQGYTEFFEYLYEKHAFSFLSLFKSNLISRQFSLASAIDVAKKNGHKETAKYLKSASMHTDTR